MNSKLWDLLHRVEVIWSGDPGRPTPKKDIDALVNSSKRLSLSCIFSFPRSWIETFWFLADRTYISSVQWHNATPNSKLHYRHYFHYIDLVWTKTKAAALNSSKALDLETKQENTTSSWLMWQIFTPYLTPVIIRSLLPWLVGELVANSWYITGKGRQVIDLTR